jgi:hypothetical protein
MRCPQCNQRNSIAAKACEFCKEKFQSRPISNTAKIIAGVGVLVLVAGIAWSLIYPKIADPEIALSSHAKRVAQGPSSPDDAYSLNKKLNSDIQKFLQNFGTLESPQLLTKLRTLLPSNAFEAHIVDLPRALKIVEIDTVLQATTYLVMPPSIKDGQPKIFVLKDIEVFDDGRIIKDAAGPILVLIGHTSGQPPHKPQIKTYALLPDDIVDETTKLVPPINGYGTAKFAKNNRDLNLELSLVSMGQKESLFASVSPYDEALAFQQLQWKGDKYLSKINYLSSPIYALYNLAKSTKYPNAPDPSLGKVAAKFINDNKNNFGKLEIARIKAKPASYEYLVKETNSNNKYKFVVAKNGKNWLVTTIDLTKENKIADATQKQSQSPVSQPKSIVKPEITASNSAKDKPKLDNKEEEKPIETNSIKVVPMKASKACIHSKISSDKIMLRNAPYVGAKANDQIAKGVPVNIIGKANGWYKVNCNGKEGYVYAGLVDFDKPEAYTTAVVTKNKSTSRVGDRVVVIGGIHNHKYKVQLANGKIIYLDKDALDVAVEMPPELVP